MAQFIQELDRIDFKNTASDMIAVGDIVPVGKMHGVAITDIAPGAIGAVKVTGCFIVDAVAVGDVVYFDKTQKRATKTDTNPVLGIAISAKSASAKTVDVALWPNVEK